MAEHCGDRGDCQTQVSVDFGGVLTGVYATQGKNMNIRTWWKNNDTVVVETQKNFTVLQKWPRVIRFRKTVNIIYIE